MNEDEASGILNNAKETNSISMDLQNMTLAKKAKTLSIFTRRSRSTKKLSVRRGSREKNGEDREVSSSSEDEKKSSDRKRQGVPDKSSNTSESDQTRHACFYFYSSDSEVDVFDEIVTLKPASFFDDVEPRFDEAYLEINSIVIEDEGQIIVLPNQEKSTPGKLSQETGEKNVTGEREEKPEKKLALLARMKSVFMCGWKKNSSTQYMQKKPGTVEKTRSKNLTK